MVIIKGGYIYIYMEKLIFLMKMTRRKIVFNVVIFGRIFCSFSRNVNVKIKIRVSFRVINACT